MPQCSARVLGISAVTVLLGTIVIRWGVLDPLIKTELQKRLRLDPGTHLWDIWTDAPIPIYIKFHFFNVTNPDEVVRGAKPDLEEVGPYVYEEKRRKIILNVNDDTIKYRPKTLYYFRPDLSYGSDDDNVTLLNVPYVGIARLAWDISKSPFVLSTLDEMLSEKGEKLFQTNKVREYLFEGVSIENFMELLSLPVADVFSAEFSIPKRLMDGSFGFFDDKNGTADDVWIVGKNDDEFAMAKSWNGKSELKFWKDKKCDKIEGTDGTIFPPFADKYRVLKGFSPDFCRSVQMVYDKPSEFMGLSTMRFAFKPSLFGSLKQFPENECFCKNTWEYCEKGGVISLAPCIGGAPVFASQPHFMGAHKDFIEGVNGLSPLGQYKSYVDVEPTIGLPLRGTMMMQLNIELEPYSAMPAFANLPKLMFPILWAEETASITEELVQPLFLLVRALKAMDFMAGFTVLVCSIAILIAFVWQGFTQKWHHKFSSK